VPKLNEMCFAKSSTDGGSDNVQKILIAEFKRGDCFGDQCLDRTAWLKRTLRKEMRCCGLDLSGSEQGSADGSYEQRNKQHGSLNGTQVLVKVLCRFSW